ncbi:peptidoglycan editing factor PgeF [Pedococcus sp. KACC 23699]|uniref:Purine nucleoside phosphorylase n=1 Tax=Pedococcus sp. KACC 23699 TaxID=3149228 RepID=A0AAU7JRP4_9MICO
MFFARGRSGPVQWGFTDREGGLSTGDFGALNLGGHVGDDPVAVEENRSRVAQALGVQRDHLLFLQQCHGNDVLVVDAPWGDAGPPPADGVVTSTPGLALAALVADCTPVLLADPAAGVVGAVHAGRPGMTTRIVEVAVDRMRDLGARKISAVVGPSICGRCYEVPAPMRDEASVVAPEAAAVSWTGTPAIDVASGVVAQLHTKGVAVQWVPGCARESASLYSYRRDGRTGRYAGVVVLEES